MKLHGAIVAGLACIGLTACASSAKNISPAYVSPLQYQNYDCDQIGTESERVLSRAQTLAGKLNDNASGDAAAMGIGLILFSPALLFLHGNGPEATEYSQLEGEYAALEQASIDKKCNLAFQHIVPPTPAMTSTSSPTTEVTTEVTPPRVCSELRRVCTHTGY